VPLLKREFRASGPWPSITAWWNDKGTNATWWQYPVRTSCQTWVPHASL